MLSVVHGQPAGTSENGHEPHNILMRRGKKIWLRK
jgi:hypothetical protein